MCTSDGDSFLISKIDKDVEGLIKMGDYLLFKFENGKFIQYLGDGMLIDIKEYKVQLEMLEH